MLKLTTYLVAFFALFSALSASAQVRCSANGGAEVEEFNALLRGAVASASVHKKLRSSTDTYRVAVRAIVFNESAATSPKFSTEDVLSLINHANTYFKNIQVEFYLVKNQVTHLNESEFYDFKMSQEADLRGKYDVTNAVNLYLFHTISDKDKLFLNGSAALPNLSVNSNRIFLSYLDRNPEDFATLKNKIFLHELGHYFGLLHTYQDSNHPEIKKRELVLRDLGTGGNCNVTGDLLCDTQADPFERLTRISSYDCEEKLPDNFVDALGYAFQPPTNNIMSYHVRCGNVFTAQQYQRMESALGVRFSPNASYRLIANPANSITLKPLEKKQFCAGENVRLKYETFGNFEASGIFFVEMSDVTGLNFSPVPATFLAGKEAIVHLPEDGKAGSSYRFRVASVYPDVQSSVSESFSIDTPGNVTMSLAANVLRPGNSTTLSFAFDGSGPWTVVLDNGITLNNVEGRYQAIQVQPLVATTYRVLSAVGKCGDVNVQNSVILNIAEPALKFQPDFKSDLCQGAYVQLPLSGLKNYGLNTSYRIRLANADTTFLLKPSVSPGVLYAQIPNVISQKSVFRLMVEGPAVEDFSNAIEVNLRPRALSPTAISPIDYCFNAEARPLYAFGVNLVWYNQKNDLIGSSKVSPATTSIGTTSYFVSQSNQWGCESERTEVKVIVKPPLTASLSGDNIINFGEQTDLTMRFTGDAPWSVELSNGERISTQSVLLRTPVRPRKTETYTITKATNSCGTALVDGSARIVVVYPLGIEEQTADGILLFPNPTDKIINLDVASPDFVNKPVEVELLDISGRPVTTLKKRWLVANKPFMIDVHHLENGTYFLRLKSEALIKTKRFLIQK